MAGCQNTPICTMKLDKECPGTNWCWLKLALTRKQSQMFGLYARNVVYYIETVACYIQI